MRCPTAFNSHKVQVQEQCVLRLKTATDNRYDGKNYDLMGYITDMRYQIRYGG